MVATVVRSVVGHPTGSTALQHLGAFVYTVAALVSLGVTLASVEVLAENCPVTQFARPCPRCHLLRTVRCWWLLLLLALAFLVAPLWLLGSARCLELLLLAGHFCSHHGSLNGCVPVRSSLLHD